MLNLLKSKEKEWPFDQSKNCATYTIKQIMNKEVPILVAYHDIEDHSWEFLSNIETTMDDAMLVSLESITNIDPTVFEIAMIEPGYHAWREAVGKEWNIEKTPIEE